MLDLGTHSASVTAVTGTERVVLSASLDKSVRLWRTDSGRLLRTLRVPMDGFTGGQLDAVELTPDTHFVLLGGYTSPDPQRLAQHNGFSVYVYDLRRQIDDPVSRIDGLEARIRAIRFSPDGRWLAVLQAGSYGLLIYDWVALTQGRPSAPVAIRATDGGFWGVDFSPSGGLALTSLGGRLTVYSEATRFAASLRTFDLTRMPLLSRPRFSPNGNRIAVVSEAGEYALVDVAGAHDVSYFKVPDSADLPILNAVEWWADGTGLVLAGESARKSAGRICTLRLAEATRCENALDMTRRVLSLRRIANNLVAYGSADGEVGLLEVGHGARWRQRPGAIHYDDDPEHFRVSRDGSALVLKPREQSSWSILDLSTSVPAKTVTTQANPPIESITSHLDQRAVIATDGALSIGGRPLTLDYLERAFCVGEAAHGFFVGTSWAVRKYSASGEPIWVQRLPAAVDAVRASADEKWVIVWLNDGSLRWLRGRDGEPILSAVLVDGGTRWVVWTASGYYTSSLTGDGLFGWVLNTPGANQSAILGAHFYSANQFERMLYAPSEVTRSLRGMGEPGAQPPSPKTGSTSIILDALPPDVEIGIAETGRSSVRAQITVRASSSAVPIEDWSVFANGIPVVRGRDRLLSAAKGDFTALRREVDIDLHEKLTAVRVEAANAKALGQREVLIEALAPQPPPRGDLFVAAIGVSTFADARITPLMYAAHDAEDLAAVLEATGRSRFAQVHRLVMSDNASLKPTRANIATLGSFLDDAGAEDTVVLFLASHGFSDPRGNFLFVPADAHMADIEARLAGRAEAGAGTLLDWQFFFNILRHTAGHRVLIVDTCSSAAIKGTFDVHSLAKRSMSSSFALLAASGSMEESQELPAQQHGLFTFGLLQALRSGYDPDGDGQVSLSEAFEFAFDKVQELHNKAVGPQTPQMVVPPALEGLILSAAPRQSVTANN
jgi:WD40 repeat protein